MVATQRERTITPAEIAQMFELANIPAEHASRTGDHEAMDRLVNVLKFWSLPEDVIKTHPIIGPYLANRAQ